MAKHCYLCGTTDEARFSPSVRSECRHCAAARARAHRAAQPERYRAANARHRQRHLHEERARQREQKRQKYPTDRPRIIRAVNRNRVRRFGNGGDYTEQEWQVMVALFGGCCVYCGEARELTRDHNVPLTRGGTDDITNILPACLPCHRRKNDRTAREFIAGVPAVGIRSAA